MKLTVPSSTVVGQYLQLAAYSLAIVVAYVYTAGYMLGVKVHQANDFLADFHSLTWEGKKSCSLFYVQRFIRSL
jgi:hypothetical protein